jgi:uncharacterized membrane protein
MPFCTQCGQQVASNDAFCAKCGLKQGGAGGGAQGNGGRPRGWDGNDFAKDVKPRTIAALCYLPVCGWIASLYVLAGERFRSDRMTRFHAFQGFYLFVGWLMLQWVVGPMIGYGSRRWVVSLAKTGFSILGIVMMVKTLRNEDERLPVVGDLADRSVGEQL